MIDDELRRRICDYRAGKVSVPPLTRAALARHPELKPSTPRDIPDEWDQPVARMIERLAALAAECRMPIRILHIKEKWGTLRVNAEVDEVPPGTGDPSKPRRSGRLGYFDNEEPGTVRAEAAALIAQAHAACSNLLQ